MRRIGTTPLWIGHVGDVRDLRSIHRAGILAMVDLAVNEAPATVNREMVYCRFPLVDGAGNGDAILRTAIDTVASLLRADVPTLVYCSAGMSRSVAVGAAGLARATGARPRKRSARSRAAAPRMCPRRSGMRCCVLGTEAFRGRNRAISCSSLRTTRYDVFDEPELVPGLRFGNPTDRHQHQAGGRPVPYLREALLRPGCCGG